MAELKKTISIPQTRARLKPYIAIYGALYDGTKELSQTELLAIPLKEIGAVRKFSYKNVRKDIGDYRVFGEKEFGKIKETYPSLGGYELVFDTVVMYKNSFFEQFGYDEADIMYQHQPAIIQVVLKAPDNIPKKTLTFTDVWFRDNSIEFEADADDLLITKEINAKAAEVIPS